MRDAFKAHALSILNYALMPNHFHIQALTGDVPVGVAMHQLLTRYSLYYNRVYERVGHLFQNRFKSFLCRDDAYMVQLPVYLSRNPVRAKLVVRPEDWEWSGHNELASGKTRFLDLSRLAEVTGWAADEWRASYLELIARGVPQPRPDSNLEELLDIAAQHSGISLKDLQEGCHGAPFTAARRLFAHEALKRGHLKVDIASVLDCVPSAISAFL